MRLQYVRVMRFSQVETIIAINYSHIPKSTSCNHIFFRCSLRAALNIKINLIESTIV